MMLSHLEGAHKKKHPLIFQVWINALSKPKGVVANLTTSTGLNLVPTNMLLLIVLFITKHNLFDGTLHTCLLHFKMPHPGIRR